MSTLPYRSTIWSALSLAAALAACGSNEPIPDNAHQDAAPGGLGGATSSGGAVATGGAATGSGGAAGVVGAGGLNISSGGATTIVAASGGATTSTGGKVTSSGGITSVGGAAGGAGSLGGTTARDAGSGAGGQAGVAGSGIDASNTRDAIGAGDLIATSPDTSKNDAPAADVAADTAGPDGLTAAQQEYVETFAEPYCTRLAECCAQRGFPTPSLAACEKNELGFVKHLSDGTSVIDPTTIQTIITGLKTSCDQPSYALLGSTTKGTRQPGEPCEDSAQCIGTPVLCLTPDGSASPGKCMTPPRGKAGDGCSVTCDDYTTCSWTTSGGKSPYAICYDQDGLRCDSVTSTCVPITAVGSKCSDFTECGEHAECSNGTCQAKKPLGADCGTGVYCDRGLECRNTGDAVYKCQKYSIAWSGSCSP